MFSCRTGFLLLTMGDLYNGQWSPGMLPLLKKLAGKQLAELERVYGYEEYKKLRMQIEENF